MKNRKQTIVGTAFSTVFIIGILFVSSHTYGATHQLYTSYGFINLLISKGIILESKTEKARELLNLIEKKESVAGTVTSKDGIEVSVSQYIEHGDLTYTRFENIEGLLLAVKNTSDKAQMLTAKRGCQVVYRIYDSTDALVYSSSDEKVCQTSEKVTYVLTAGKTRIFPITHAQNKFALQQGTYRIEIEYPGYGKGVVTVTVK